jgi:hypothetical protein
MRLSPFVALVPLLLGARLSAQSISRDSLRRELPLVIAVQRLPSHPDSVWVAGIPPRGALTGALPRFHRDNPFFIVYLLQNGTTFDQRAFLAGLPASADAPALFYQRLGEDTAFIGVLWRALDGYLRGEAGLPPVSRPQYPADTLILFAAHFVHLEADSTGPSGFNICAKSWLLRDLPLPTSIALESWIYSIVRPGQRHIMAGIDSVFTALPRGPMSGERFSEAERRLWLALAHSPDFRGYMLAEISRRGRYLPFTVSANGGD